METKYTQVEFEVIQIDVDDVITTSCAPDTSAGGQGPGCPVLGNGNTAG